MEIVEAYEGLKECKMYCNEGQIMPAMVYYVEDCGLSIRAASRCVDKDTGGAVTASRAAKVYQDRKGATNVADKPTSDKGLGLEPGWVLQCQDVFYAAVIGDYMRIKNRKAKKVLEDIIKKHSAISGVSYKILTRWYNAKKERNQNEKLRIKSTT